MLLYNDMIKIVLLKGLENSFEHLMVLLLSDNGGQYNNYWVVVV